MPSDLHILLNGTIEEGIIVKLFRIVGTAFLLFSLESVSLAQLTVAVDSSTAYPEQLGFSTTYRVTGYQPYFPVIIVMTITENDACTSNPTSYNVTKGTGAFGLVTIPFNIPGEFDLKVTATYSGLPMRLPPPS